MKYVFIFALIVVVGGPDRMLKDLLKLFKYV